MSKASGDFKEVDGVWTYKGIPVEEIEKLTQEDIDFALQFQKLSEENKTLVDVEMDRLEINQGSY